MVSRPAARAFVGGEAIGRNGEFDARKCDGSNEGVVRGADSFELRAVDSRKIDLTGAYGEVVEPTGDGFPLFLHGGIVVAAGEVARG